MWYKSIRKLVYFFHYWKINNEILLSMIMVFWSISKWQQENQLIQLTAIEVK
jgi:hypothetical protein